MHVDAQILFVTCAGHAESRTDLQAEGRVVSLFSLFSLLAEINKDL
jgi:hypothetical protein